MRMCTSLYAYDEAALECSFAQTFGVIKHYPASSEAFSLSYSYFWNTASYSYVVFFYNFFCYLCASLYKRDKRGWYKTLTSGLALALPPPRAIQLPYRSQSRKEHRQQRRDRLTCAPTVFHRFFSFFLNLL